MYSFCSPTKWVCLLGIVFLALCHTTDALAQFNGAITGEAVNITLSPQYPSPQETVTANLDDYAIEATGATIVWLENNAEITAARNRRTITFLAPDIGQTTKLTARLVFKNKPTIEATVTITPVYVDVIVEPLTYTPVFYKGRALPVNGSLVNLTALIHTTGGLVDPANYTYNWQLNTKSVYGGPRTGNNRAQVTVPNGKNSTIALSVTDSTGRLIVRRLITIPAVDVDLEFYEVSTLYGLSRQAIADKLNLIGNSSTIRAVPYNLDTRAIKGALFTQWSIDGLRSTPDTNDPFEITLRRQSVGGATVGFKLRNTQSLLQGDERSFRINF